VLRCLPRTSYVNEPGTTYLYSNIGYATLGLAIERAGRQPYVDQVRDRILVPLGMSRSVMGDASPAVRVNLARGYQLNEKSGKVSREDADRGLDGRGYRVPNGGLFSTINDLAKFAAWEMGDGPPDILKKETQEANYSRALFYIPGMYAGYGVGFQVRWLGPVLMVGHGGSTDGYHSAVYVNRDTHLGVIALRNCDSCPVDAGAVAATALDKLARVALQRLSTVQTNAGELTGVWTGTLDKGDGTSTAYLDLKQTDADLTGSCGPDEGRQSKIAHAKVTTADGVTSVTFDATQANGSVMKFDLKLVDGRLKGNVTLESGGEIRGRGTLDVGREKKGK